MTALTTIAGSAASHRGPDLPTDNHGVLFAARGPAALAVVTRAMHHSRSNSLVADLVVGACMSRFRDRRIDLADVWWTAEHGDASAFASQPRVDRDRIAAHVGALLQTRSPATLGDAAVLAAVTAPERGLHDAHARLVAHGEADRLWRGARACASVAVFEDGLALLAQVGHGRILRVNGGELAFLTSEDDARLGVDAPAAATRRVPFERGDVFLLGSRGLIASYAPEDLRAAMLEHGADAALRLVERASQYFEGHSLDNVAAVSVAIL